MIRLLRKLFALPFLWVGQLAGMFSPAVSSSALKAAWWISGDGHTGRLALIRLAQQYGHEAALSEALRWMQTRPRPEVAAFAGVLAGQAGRQDEARRLLEQGRQSGDDPRGMLELLEVMLACEGGDGERILQTSREMEARRDLPPDVSRMVLHQLLGNALAEGRFDEARQRARLLLEVADDMPAHVALWALARREGRTDRADGHLRRAFSADPAGCLYHQVLAALAIGEDEQARHCLAELEGHNSAMAQALRARVLEPEEPRP
ncbi:MAG: hypothetical protein ACYS5V_05300 [Planctomycetota bacterium]